MKKYIKGVITGAIIASVLMNTAFSATVKKSIEVVYNSINITVNGDKVNSDNILYNGTTYVPLRAISEILGKEVRWDKSTNTASINDEIFEKSEKSKVDSKENLNEETSGQAVDSQLKKAMIGETITDNGLSVTLEKIQYNDDDFRPNDSDSTSIYSKGFGVYYKIENNTEKTYRKPSIRFKLVSSKFENELNSMGYSHHPVKASDHIYPGETLVGFYQYTFERDIIINELEIFMPDSNNLPLQSFGTWLIK